MSLLVMLLCVLYAAGQSRRVQNRPYTDLRTFHFGVFVGTHLQDIEFVNVGPQTLESEDGTMAERLVTCDQDRWDPGFNVGVLGEFRLSEYFQFRVAPAMYFGTRHLTFHFFPNESAGEKEVTERQDLKTAYISTALDLIVASPRFNNHRPYLMVGLNPMINLSARDNDYLKLKGTDLFFEIGVGCDFYLPFFKLRPELKFMYGLGNKLDTKHAEKLKDKNMLMFTKSVSEATTKMFVLSFYFE